MAAAAPQPVWQGQQPAAPMPPSATYSYGQAPPQRRSRLWMVVAPVLVVVVVLVGVFYSRTSRSNKLGSADDLNAQVEALKKRLNETPQGLDAGVSADSAEIAAAKREMERLSSQAGLPPADSSGNIHLRAGGSVTRDKYRETIQSLNSPLIER